MNEQTTAGVRVGAGGGSGLGLGVLVVWLAGNRGVDMPAEVGTVIGAMAMGGGAAVGAWGIIGCCKRLLYGRGQG